MSGTTTQRWRPETVGLLAVLLLTAAAYVGVVHAGFVWDDVPLVQRNRLTGDLANLPRFFAMDLWDASPVESGISGYYRPLMLVSLALDRFAYGLWAPGHHLQGFAWHLLAVTFLFRLVARGAGWQAAVLAAGLFALHPVQSEAVVWISARNDPMAAALGFASLDRLAFRPATPGRLWAAGLLGLAAGLAKESVILLPALLLVLDLGEGRRPALVRYVPFAVAIGVVLCMRALAGIGAASWPPAEGWLLLARHLPEVVGVYGAAIVEPWPLSAGRSVQWVDREPTWRLVLGGVACAAFVVAAIRARPGGRRLPLAGLVWAALAFLPVLLPIADKGMLGERYLYLPLAGVGLALGVLAGRRAVALAAILAVPSLVALHVRLPDWVDDLGLWSAAAADTPNPLSRASFGHALSGAGRADLALAAFVSALDDPVPDLSACPRVVGTALAVGNVDLAVQLGRWAAGRGCEVRGSPTAGAYAGQYGVALAFSGQWTQLDDLLSQAEEDPEGRLDVVRGARLLVEGDEPAFQRLAGRQRDPADFEAQARRLAGSAAVDRRPAGVVPTVGAHTDVPVPRER